MKLNILSWIILSLSVIGICSCQDEELLSVPGNYSLNSATRAAEETTSRLTLQENGYWKAKGRVPLVGAGRIVDNLSGPLVSVGSTGTEAQILVDTDLTNIFTPGSIVGAEALTNQLVSIRDLNYVYDGGQKAGFVCKNQTDGLLDLSVLKSFWIDTYLKGERQEQHVFTQATSVLDLGLGNISGGGENQTFLVEAEFSKPFDEIRIGVNGIELSAIQELGIYYAYVGENPIIPAVNNGGSYFNNQVTAPYEGSYIQSSLNKLINDKLTDGIEIGLVSALFQPHMSVNFGKDVPAGSEVGFYVTSGSLLDVGAGKTILITTYDANDKEVDRYSYTQVVELGLLGGGEFLFSLTTTKPCRRVRIEFLGLNLKLGVSVVHYAYVREKTTVDASSYFTVANATVYNPNYRFAEPVQGTVKYELIGGPNRSNAKIQKEKDGNGWLLTGMNITGNYTVKAIYTDEQGNVSEQVAVITRLKKKQTACDVHLVNTEKEPNIYRAYIPDQIGGIEIGGDIIEGDQSYIVDENTENYVAYKQGVSISLITNDALVGVERIDGKTINAEKQKIRVGFVINKSLDVLGASALQFLRIKLYKSGKEIYAGVGKENNGIDVSLIGSSKDKTRLSVDTELEFDKIELYSTGLLNLNLVGALHIYHAFWEMTDDCGDPGEECMQLISNANYGAVATTDTKGLAGIGGTVFNLGNMVDGNIDSHATLTRPVDAATDTEIKVTFNTIKANQEVGFILTGVTGLTNVDLIGIMQIKAYKDDNEITDNTTEGGLLGLKLAGSGQRKYISITPTSDFNELHLIIGKGVGTLSNYLINGVYLRPDYDGDGVMDCITDELSTEIINLYVEPEDICIGGEAAFRVDGGEEGVTYTLEFIDKHNGAKSHRGDVTINSSGYLEFTDPGFFVSLPVGEYYVSVLHSGKIILNKIGSLIIHPQETTWKKDALSTDWNDWNNWDRGTPWECTNVILPSAASRYPVLKAGAEKAYCCQHIHFEPNAELVGQTYLKYTTAFVDAKLTGDSYQLMSAPLRSMVTGDMFVQEESRREGWNDWRNTIDVESGLHPNYFTPIINAEKNDVSDYVEHRIEPVIYQRFFSKSVVNAVVTRATNSDDAAIRHTDWSRSFNAVGTRYESGQGFALKIKDGVENMEYIFHFPKSHTRYHYYDIQGNPVGNMTESVTRTQVGKLMVDNQDRMPRSIPLERQSEGTEFLLGNPFMAHINIRKFLNENSNVISDIQIYRNGSYVTVKADGTSSAINVPVLIKPMEAVFITAKNRVSDITVTLSEDMITQAAGSNVRKASNALSRIYLNARRNNQISSCVVLQSVSAQDGYRSGEDAFLLIESEAKPEVAVYTAADGEALSIQCVHSASRIPVGFFMKSEGRVELSFQTQGNDWDGWRFVDSQTGKRYSLTENITLDDVASGSGRFYLEKED